jgi:hypothetical protein
MLDKSLQPEWRRSTMEITKDTKVSAILENYGDIADVMEIFGIKRVGRYSLRRMLTKAITVENAARIHRVPLDEFMETLKKAAAIQEQKEKTDVVIL